MLLPAVLFASLALVQQTPPPSPQPGLAAPETQTETRTQTAALPAAEAAEPPSEVVRICRTEPVTGSRFGRRVCRSAVETADERRESVEMLRRMQGSRLPDGQ